jgi:hypothetical protein
LVEERESALILGTFSCKYEGATCKKDIDSFLPKLEQVYGIKLSNERVIWENPDKISKDARQSPTGGSYKGGQK